MPRCLLFDIDTYAAATPLAAMFCSIFAASLFFGFCLQADFFAGFQTPVC